MSFVSVVDPAPPKKRGIGATTPIPHIGAPRFELVQGVPTDVDRNRR